MCSLPPKGLLVYGVCAYGMEVLVGHIRCLSYLRLMILARLTWGQGPYLPTVPRGWNIDVGASGTEEPPNRELRMFYWDNRAFLSMQPSKPREGSNINQTSIHHEGCLLRPLFLNKGCLLPSSLMLSKAFLKIPLAQTGIVIPVIIHNLHHGQ